MEQVSRSSRALLLLLLSPLTTSTATCALFVFSFIFGSHGANAYQNYTVGDSLGWYDRLQQPQVNYQKWVAGKNFTLGDFLIFHTDKSRSVIQTVAVPLLKEGMAYFFSGNFDGRQCRHGQLFKINVTRGEGLPESLRHLYDSAPAPVPAREVPGDSAGQGSLVAVHFIEFSSLVPVECAF